MKKHIKAACLFSILSSASVFAGISNVSLNWLKLPSSYELPSSKLLHKVGRYFPDANNLPTFATLTDTHAYLNLVSAEKFHSYRFNFAGDHSFQPLHKAEPTLVTGQAHNQPTVLWSP